jgi:hypothetical protein
MRYVPPEKYTIFAWPRYQRAVVVGNQQAHWNSPMFTISLRVLKNRSADENNPVAISEEEVPSRMLPTTETHA